MLHFHQIFPIQYQLSCVFFLDYSWGSLTEYLKQKYHADIILRQKYQGPKYREGKCKWVSIDLLLLTSHLGTLTMYIDVELYVVKFDLPIETYFHNSCVLDILDTIFWSTIFLISIVCLSTFFRGTLSLPTAISCMPVMLLPKMKALKLLLFGQIVLIFLMFCDGWM